MAHKGTVLLAAFYAAWMFLVLLLVFWVRDIEHRVRDIELDTYYASEGVPSNRVLKRMRGD